MDFVTTFRQARRSALLTQSEVAERSGVARPNIAAYEAGRREPKATTMERLLEAVGVTIAFEPMVEWTWTDTLRPYAVPSSLWRLAPEQALRILTAPTHMWWSGDPRTFDLADRRQRLRAYEIVLREGQPEDIETTVDGLLLTESFEELVLPRELRRAWLPVVQSPSTQEQPAT